MAHRCLGRHWIPISSKISTNLSDFLCENRCSWPIPSLEFKFKMVCQEVFKTWTQFSDLFRQKSRLKKKDPDRFRRRSQKRNLPLGLGWCLGAVSMIGPTFSSGSHKALGFTVGLIILINLKEACLFLHGWLRMECCSMCLVALWFLQRAWGIGVSQPPSTRSQSHHGIFFWEPSATSSWSIRRTCSQDFPSAIDNPLFVDEFSIAYATFFLMSTMFLSGLHHL